MHKTSTTMVRKWDIQNITAHAKYEIPETHDTHGKYEQINTQHMLTHIQRCVVYHASAFGVSLCVNVEISVRTITMNAHIIQQHV